MLVGNGVTDYNYDTNPAEVDTAYNFNIIPEEIYKPYKEQNCFFPAFDIIPYNNSAECK
jgi:hypothetical protein